jgi:hypothetical protein
MDSFNLDATGNLKINPSASSSKNDFDFLIGKWRIENRKLASRLSNCDEWIEFEATQEVRKILLGLGNIDFFNPGPGNPPFEGMTLRLFDLNSKLWSIYWADSDKGVLDPPVLGSFDKNIGHFFTRDIYNGVPVLVAFKWEAHADSPVWSQAFSADNGETWEWNWYMHFFRID